MNKKTISLTLLSLASVFALSTTVVNAEENGENAPAADATETTTKTNLTTQGDGISISATSGDLQFNGFTINAGEGDQSVIAKTGLSINVSDLRGTHDGWHVTAEHNGLSAQGKSDPIEGATITLNGGKLENNVDKSDKTPTPVLKSLDPTSTLSIGKSAVLISNASVGMGMGLWSHTWDKGEVTLTIPAIEARDMYEDEYSTTITWTLGATPQAETAE